VSAVTRVVVTSRSNLTVMPPLEKKKSSAHDTTVSRLIDFLPLAGNHSLEVGNNLLLFFVPEAT
jgi:hypothetical protein